MNLTMETKRRRTRLKRGMSIGTVLRSMTTVCGGKGVDGKDYMEE
jgi:hypothetical protein